MPVAAPQLPDAAATEVRAVPQKDVARLAEAIGSPDLRPEPGAGSLTLRGVTFSPARFCAPMAGVTHSAFRRLVADFGGAGALFTEMICARRLLREDVRQSPTLKRRPAEGKVIYQLMVTEPEIVAPAIERLAVWRPDGLDLNCACPAPKIRQRGAGCELFADRPRLEGVLRALRREWPGLLTVKIRLGRPEPDWRATLEDRLALFADCGVDAVILHPRFTDEKLKRRARHELFPELVARARVPLLASGDLHDAATVRCLADALEGVVGILVGRRAAVQPWVFCGWTDANFVPDPLETWRRFCAYVREDFPEAEVFPRLQSFTAYFARNFRFGHELFRASQSSRTAEELEARALAFLGRRPERLQEPDMAGF